MPDPTAEALKAHLDEKWTNTVCPICEGSDWGAADGEYALFRIAGAGAGVYAEAFTSGIRLGVIGCRDCGYTFMVSTVAAGIRGDGDAEADGGNS